MCVREIWREEERGRVLTRAGGGMERRKAWNRGDNIGMTLSPIAGHI